MHKMQHNSATNKTDSKSFSDKKSLKITLEYIKGNSMTDDFFVINEYVKTNYHIVSYEIDRISVGNVIHCTKVKNYIIDDF